MISLFLNTSSEYLHIALLKDNKVYKEKYLKLAKALSKEALINIKYLLEENNLKPNDLEEIICVRGPGSFTGLRVGVTIAKTYAHFLNKKLYSLSSLEVLATSLNSEIIVPLINARRGYVYGAIYDKDYNVLLKEQYLTLEKLQEKAESYNKKITYISNDNFPFLKTSSYIPNLNNTLKFIKLKKEEPLTFVPTYLKKTEAEEKLQWLFF